MNVADFISSHPIIALIVGVIHLTVAETLYSLSYPPIVMQSFQIAAWTITIGVGLITIYGFFKKKKQ